MSHRLVDGVYGTATYPPRIYGPPASVLGIVPKGHEWIIEQIPSVDGENKTKKELNARERSTIVRGILKPIDTQYLIFS
ncbi:unnamed protein product [Penicillium roqueforti FM164]|uniref:Genomic scaffold, ProqFM164S04 n=1 Tax=Penicillium roqueforti (strain FM164) TaxID=1365484 RepID=W6QFV9_PENRF|nr:unnamed protein product [Penicillium roqueforti FM164]